MRRSIRSSVQWNVLGKLQKAVDAVSLNLWSSSLLRFSWRCKKKPGSASKSSLSARDLHTCLSEQHHYTCAFTGEDVAASMLSASRHLWRVDLRKCSSHDFALTGQRRVVARCGVAPRLLCSTSERGCKCTEGISLNWVFLCTLCQISLPRSQVHCLDPIVRPRGAATTWLVLTGLNIGHCCRRVHTSHRR